MKFKICFDDPDYNEIINSIVSQVFPNLDDKHSEESFLPVLKEGVEIVKDMPQDKKSEFAYYLLSSLISNKRSSNIYRSIEKICKNKLGVSLKINEIKSERKEKNKNTRIELYVALSNVDYKALCDLIIGINGVSENIPDLLKPSLKFIAGNEIAFGIISKIANIGGVESAISGRIQDVIFDKTRIHIRNISYKFL